MAKAHYLFHCIGKAPHDKYNVHADIVTTTEASARRAFSKAYNHLGVKLSRITKGANVGVW